MHSRVKHHCTHEYILDKDANCAHQLLKTPPHFGARENPVISWRLISSKPAGSCCSLHVFVVYAVRATERVPAGSCHFPCFTDPSKSVVSFPCVRKWERIKTKCATSAWALAHWLRSRCYSTREQKASVVRPVRKECKVAGPWTSGASPIVPFMFSGQPQGLQAGME